MEQNIMPSECKDDDDSNNMRNETEHTAENLKSVRGRLMTSTVIVPESIIIGHIGKKIDNVADETLTQFEGERSIGKDIIEEKKTDDVTDETATEQFEGEKSIGKDIIEEKKTDDVADETPTEQFEGKKSIGTHIEETDLNIDDEFVDNYSHTVPDVFYTTHNIPGPGIDAELFYSQISRRCLCTLDEVFDPIKSSTKLLELGQSEIDTNRHPKFTDGKYGIQNEQFDVDVIHQKEMCTGNCQCNLARNYSSGKLNVDGYQLPIYECNNLCGCYNPQSISRSRKSVGDSSKCLTKCSNRLIQKGPNKHLEIFRHSEVAIKGNGVRATHAIERGEFICEYVGEVIHKVEAKRRYALYQKEHQERQQPHHEQQKPRTESRDGCHFYIFHLNEIVDNPEGPEQLEPNSLLKVGQDLTGSCEKDSVSTSPSERTSMSRLANTKSDSSRPTKSFEMFVDATKFGNIARYINHSCDPNCTVLPVRVNSMYPSLGIFARRDIERGEELAYDYAGLDDEHGEKKIGGIIDEKKENMNNIGESSNGKVDRNTKGNGTVESMNESVSESEEDVSEGGGSAECVDESTISGTSTNKEYSTKGVTKTRNGNALKRTFDVALACTESPKENNLKPCCCGHDKCRKFLPYIPLQ